MNPFVALAPLAVLALVACAPPAPSPAAVKGDTAQAGDGPAGADAGMAQDGATPQVQPADLHAIGLAFKLRAVSAQHGESLWPGFRLHEVPLYLIYRNDKGKSLRGFIIGFAKVPPGAVPVAQSELGTLAGLGVPVHRHDAAVKILSEVTVSDGYLKVAGEMAVVAAYSEGMDDKAWAGSVFTANFTRLRELDAEWAPVIGCGDPNKWSAELEASTLMFVEAALIRDALATTDAALAKTLLLEFKAVRDRAVSLDPMVARMFNDAENNPGAEFFVVRRALVAAGFLTAADVAAHYQAELGKAFVLPMKDFRDYFNFQRGGEMGAALLELAARFGWTVEPTYRAGESFFHLVESKLGPPAAGALESAKKRYDYAAFEAKAKQAVALKVAESDP